MFPAACRGLQRRTYNLSNAMRKRYLFWSGLALMAILLTLVVWQVSFTSANAVLQTCCKPSFFWAVSTLIFRLVVSPGSCDCSCGDCDVPGCRFDDNDERHRAALVPVRVPNRRSFGVAGWWNAFPEAADVIERRLTVALTASVALLVPPSYTAIGLLAAGKRLGLK